MRSFLVAISLLGLTCAGCGKKEAPRPAVLSDRTQAGAANALKIAHGIPAAVVLPSAGKTTGVIGSVKDLWERKQIQWRLKDADLKTLVERSGRLVARKSAGAGARVVAAIENRRVETVIGFKLLGARDLSAFKIDVDADRGVVTLKGSVESLQLIGNATALVLDTEGVTQVVSRLHVEPNSFGPRRTGGLPCGTTPIRCDLASPRIECFPGFESGHLLASIGARR